MLNRRTVLGTAAAFVALPSARAEESKGTLVSVRGTRLFVERYGDPAAMPILYVHGGPGSGSYDAGVYQGPRLGAAAQLICLDQRGVLRSDPAASVTVNDIVEDLEALRQTLGLRRWVLWGHSFGGLYAADYALRYPHAVSGLVFENATLDPDGSLKSMMRACADLIAEKGNKPDADALLALADANVSSRERLLGYVRYSQKLGADRERLYVHQAPLLDFFSKLVAASNLGAKWGQGNSQYEALVKDDALYEDLRPKLAAITAPSLMIRGRYDHVTTPDQVEVFLKRPHRTLEVFDRSSHFVHVEEADGFAQSVLRFVREIE
ncbi:alpha/beta fold hydrolase [Rhizomicrobium electricum]|uniref:Alpha/beta hydrolase n=1 Tax=Rhizomicrobium electricum TaxID=480070 RepID=A0ABP3P4R8_9PROT|nr:alpha/beta hydrolase [Rhizomicrobium electricum]NIJ47799.1 proline iminopeptidase [Rhizomicrobium electricum]